MFKQAEKDNGKKTNQEETIEKNVEVGKLKNADNSRQKQSNIKARREAQSWKQWRERNQYLMVPDRRDMQGDIQRGSGVQVVFRIWRVRDNSNI